MLRSLVATLLIVGAGAPSVEAPLRFELSEAHMGTTFRIVVYAPDSTEALAGAQAAFATVARLESLFSDYRADSEVSLLANDSGSGSGAPVSRELWTVLRLAQTWSERTDGAFDVTVGPLTRLWRWSARRGALPEPPRLAKARAAVGYEHLSFDSKHRVVRFGLPGMAIDLGGIAKGYAADSALAELAHRGLRSALVDAGGDLALGAPPPGKQGWRVELPGGDVLVLAAAAVATSGDRYRYLEVDGVRYSHIVDPRTGIGVQDAPTVTVVARDAASADVLASALTVMRSDDGINLIRSVAGAAARVTGIASWQSDSFPRPLRRPRPGADR